MGSRCDINLTHCIQPSFLSYFDHQNILCLYRKTLQTEKKLLKTCVIVNHCFVTAVTSGIVGNEEKVAPQTAYLASISLPVRFSIIFRKETIQRDLKVEYHQWDYCYSKFTIIFPK